MNFIVAHESESGASTVTCRGMIGKRRSEILMKRIDANSRTIRELLDAAKFSIDSIVGRIAKLRQQKQGLMYDLLTGRVRVDAACDA